MWHVLEFNFDNIIVTAFGFVCLTCAVSYTTTCDSASHGRLLESIQYTESGKPNIAQFTKLNGCFKVQGMCVCVCPHDEVRWKPRSYIWNLSSWHIVRQNLRRHNLYISVFRHRSRMNFPSHWICGFRAYLAKSTCSIVNTKHFGRCFVRCFCIWCVSTVCAR